MLKESRVKLDEFLEYKKSVDEKVNWFMEKIAKAEKEVEKLGKDYAKSFLSGLSTSDKKLRQLEKELEADKKQLDLIVRAKNDDPKLTKLANAVYDEFVNTKDKKCNHTSDLKLEIAHLEEELKSKREELESKQREISAREREITKERFDVIPYMDIGIREKNKLSHAATNYQYDAYVKTFGHSK